MGVHDSPPTPYPEPDPRDHPTGPPDPEEDIPWPQTMFDRPFLLLILGIAIMAVFYTGWGLLEIMTLTPAPLP